MARLLSNLFASAPTPAMWPYMHEGIRESAHLPSAAECWLDLGTADFWQKALASGFDAAFADHAAGQADTADDIRPRPVTFIFDPWPLPRWLRLILPAAFGFALLTALQLRSATALELGGSDDRLNLETPIDVTDEMGPWMDLGTFGMLGGHVQRFVDPGCARGISKGPHGRLGRLGRGVTLSLTVLARVPPCLRCSSSQVLV